MSLTEQTGDALSVSQPSRQYGSISTYGPGLTVVGDFYNSGTLFRPQTEPEIVKFGLCLGGAPQTDPAFFVGRAAEICKIHQLLQPQTADLRQRRVVLGGVGGVGKTQLALKYAERHQQSYDSIFWLNATSQLTLYASFRRVAKNLLPAREIEVLTDEQLLARVHEWLSNTRNTRWLLVLDNYDDPNQFDIEDSFPNTGHGSLIITTRLPDLVNGERLRIQPLGDPQDHLAILRIRSQRANISGDSGACQLTSRLGGLPLALATAGAHLRKTTMTCDQYLHAYEERFNINPRRPVQLPEYQNRTLYTTWDLSYRQLERDDALAAQVLKLLAYFDNQEIWFELLSAGLTDDAPEWLQDVMSSHIDFESVMATLVEYCLVEAHAEAGSYSMHSCVHDWTLAQLNNTINERLYWYAVRCVASSTADDDISSLQQFRYARLARHALRCTLSRFRIISETEKPSFSDIDRLRRVAELLAQQWQLSEAERMFELVLAVEEKAFGPDHNSTLNTVNNLGILYWMEGKLDLAEQMYKRALAGCEKAHGPDHAWTLETINNLGILHWNQNKLDLAEQMYERALAGKEKAIGPDHLSTLQTVNNLGILYVDQGKLDLAEQLFERALAEKEKAFGPDHISVLNSRYCLANLYHQQRKLDQVETVYQQLLPGYEAALGADHPSTIMLVNNFGLLYEDQDRFEEAERMYQRALVGYQKRLGLEHSRTRGAADNLSRIKLKRPQ